MSSLPIQILNPIGEVLHLKHAGQTLEFYDIPNTYKELVEFIREKTDLKGDLSISWTRTKNLSSSNSRIHEQINMVDESDWNRCKKHYQLQFQESSQKNDECIISVSVEQARRRNNVGQENEQPQVELIKQYQQQQSKLQQQPQLQYEQDNQEYTNLITSKEQQTIEYLVQRKLCQLYPELENTPTQSHEQIIQKQSKITNQIDTRSVQWCEKQPVRKLSSLPEQSLSKEESETSKEGKQMEKSAANLKKKKKKAQLFQELFSGGQASCSEESKVTPGEEMFLPEEAEICEFNVVKHGEEVTIRNGESKVVTVQIKSKYANWPRQPCQLEEIQDQHFEKIPQIIRFQADKEIQTIQIELRPLEKIKGTIISSWQFFGENSNKKFLSGVIPLKVNIV